MSNTDVLPKAVPCPNCRQRMHSEKLERHDHGIVQVDLCFACAGIWFGHLVSVQLAPAAVIDLFKEIYDQRDKPRQPIASTLTCPRCGGVLLLSFDLSKAGRFSYFSCPHGDGRFTPFLQFLKEKQFVRTLTVVELRRLKSQVRQITCSECGAPIDLEHDSQCRHCHAPVSFLDADAVGKAVQMWSEAEQRRHLAPSAAAVGRALDQIELNHGPGLSDVVGSGVGLDLVALGIHAVGSLFKLARDP
jgi:Zn-finger nucleic acid-binding protein